MRRVSRYLRDKVWKYYFNTSLIGKCYVCCNQVTKYNYGWHCSHVIPLSKKGPNTIDNLRVCCPNCNLKMKTKNLYEFINETYNDSI